MTDIRLEDDRVVAEGHAFRVEGEDLEVFSTSRLAALGTAPTGSRRALVHGSDDSLIVNFAQDYQRVQLHGPLELIDRRLPGSLRLTDRNGDTTVFIAGGIVQATREIRLAPLRDVGNTDRLSRTIQWLHDRISELEQREGITPPVIDDGRG